MHTFPRFNRPILTPFFRPVIFLPAALAILFFAALSGCAAIGQTKAVTPEDNLRYAQATLTGIYVTLGNAAADKSLPAIDARNYFQKLDEPRNLLMRSDAVIRTLPSGAAVPTDTIGQINLALTVLTAIADELRSRLPVATTAALPAKR